MPEIIRVMLVDDHAIVREGISLILETDPGIEVVGEASDGREALTMITEVEPDVMLLDLRMPGMDGLTTIEELQKEESEVAVVILTTYNEDDLMLKGLRAGARGFLLKDVDRETLLRTIRAAAGGETLLSPEVLNRALAKSGGRTDGSGEVGSLTERELSVLRAVAAGDRNKEIAVKLHISERTVKAHLTNIFHKLEVDSRAGAVAVAGRLEII